MTDKIVKKEDLFNIIKHGKKWYEMKIKDKLEELITNNSNYHVLEWDDVDKFYYIYDNECNLFIFEGKIELRCDRENSIAAYKIIKFDIETDKDIVEAYEKFKLMTMEGEEDE